jgi:hypothetical protein
MEFMDERQRYEQGNLPRDCPLLVAAILSTTLDVGACQPIVQNLTMEQDTSDMEQMDTELCAGGESH